MVGPKEKSIRVSGLKFLERGKISPGELVMLDWVTHIYMIMLQWIELYNRLILEFESSKIGALLNQRYDFLYYTTNKSMPIIDLNQ